MEEQERESTYVADTCWCDRISELSEAFECIFRHLIFFFPILTQIHKWVLNRVVHKPTPPTTNSKISMVDDWCSPSKQANRVVVLLHQNPIYQIQRKIVKSGIDLPNLMRSLPDLARSY